MITVANLRTYSPMPPFLAKDAACSPALLCCCAAAPLQVDEPGIFTTHQRASSAYRRQMATRHGGIAITYVDRNFGCAYVMTWAKGVMEHGTPPPRRRGAAYLVLVWNGVWEAF